MRHLKTRRQRVSVLCITNYFNSDDFDPDTPIKTKADLAKVLNEVDAFDLHALRTLPKPDAVAKLALTRLLKGLPMEVMELFRGIMLGADFSYFAEMAGGSIFEQLSNNPNNKPGLKQTLFTTKKQILQKCEDVKQFYSGSSFNKTSTGTEQLQIFLDRLQLLQSVISDKMDDVQAGFVRHLLQPDPYALQKYRSRTRGNCSYALQIVFLRQIRIRNFICK